MIYMDNSHNRVAITYPAYRRVGGAEYATRVNVTQASFEDRALQDPTLAGMVERYGADAVLDQLEANAKERSKYLRAEARKSMSRALKDSLKDAIANPNPTFRLAFGEYPDPMGGYHASSISSADYGPMPEKRASKRRQDAISDMVALGYSPEPRVSYKAPQDATSRAA